MNSFRHRCQILLAGCQNISAACQKMLAACWQPANNFWQTAKNYGPQSAPVQRRTCWPTFHSTSSDARVGYHETCETSRIFLPSVSLPPQQGVVTLAPAQNVCDETQNVCDEVSPPPPTFSHLLTCFAKNKKTSQTC